MTIKDTLRSAALVTIGAALGSVALACEQCDEARAAQKGSAAQAAAAPTSVSAQTVTRDADTGQLRAATPAEAKALQGGAPAARRAEPQLHPVINGVRGARMTDDYMSSAVVVRRVDGSLDKFCVDGKDAAEATVRAAAQRRPLAAAQTE